MYKRRSEAIMTKLFHLIITQSMYTGSVLSLRFFFKENDVQVRILSPWHYYLVTDGTLGKAIALLCPQTSRALHLGPA